MGILGSGFSWIGVTAAGNSVYEKFASVTFAQAAFLSRELVKFSHRARSWYSVWRQLVAAVAAMGRPRQLRSAGRRASMLRAADDAAGVVVLST